MKIEEDDGDHGVKKNEEEELKQEWVKSVNEGIGVKKQGFLLFKNKLLKKKLQTGYRVPVFPNFMIRIRPEYPFLKPGTRPELSEFGKPGNLPSFKNRIPGFPDRIFLNTPNNTHTKVDSKQQASRYHTPNKGPKQEGTDPPLSSNTKNNISSDKTRRKHTTT